MILKSNESFRNVFPWKKSLEYRFGSGRFLAEKIFIARNYGEQNEKEKKICELRHTHMPVCNTLY